jgi:hypothetical protein
VRGSAGSRRDQELLGELVREPGGAHVCGDRFGVVGETLDRHVDGVTGRSENRERAARVAVLRLADRAAVDEQDTAVLAGPRLVGVAEDEDARLFRGCEPLVQARRLG